MNDMQRSISVKESIIGKQFDRLTVIAAAEPYISPKGAKQKRYVCRCVCGAEKTIQAAHLTSGLTKSCGCSRVDSNKGKNTTHGMSSNPAFRSWRGMVDRCTNPNDSSWMNYGGRGIRVCERWMVLENFLADMGDRPEGTSLDRVDPNGHYEPSNCRWATSIEQMRNTTRNTCDADTAAKVRNAFVSGKTKAAIARQFGLHPETVRGIVNGTRWRV